MSQTTYKRILVCGDRYWTKKDPIMSLLKKLQGPDVVLIHGGARGADSISGACGKELGLTVLEFPALWDLHGKAAGPIRNRQMLTEGQPEAVFAFHEDLSESRGTLDMVKAASKAGLPVYVFDGKSWSVYGKEVNKNNKSKES